VPSPFLGESLRLRGSESRHPFQSPPISKVLSRASGPPSAGKSDASLQIASVLSDQSSQGFVATLSRECLSSEWLELMTGSFDNVRCEVAPLGANGGDEHGQGARLSGQELGGDADDPGDDSPGGHGDALMGAMIGRRSSPDCPAHKVGSHFVFLANSPVVSTQL